jgi:NitT/TauT family transport system ATP-binding protein
VTALITIDHISRLFHDPVRKQAVKALYDVSLNVERNEFLCLLGPSGCGKSTLLNLIAGFDQPTSGTVSVGGQIVKAPGADRGVVFQQPTLMPWLTVWENVAFHLIMRGVGRGERRQKAQRFIEMVGLGGFENSFPSELSGGMNQRVGIARALLMNPEVILMDEPFGALDEQTKMEMQAELRRVWRESNSTIVFVTHSVEESLVLGTHVAVMTARPGCIRELIKIDLQNRTDTTSSEFNRYKRHILSLLRPEVPTLEQRHNEPEDDSVLTGLKP